MKHLIQTLLLSLFLTAVIGGTEMLFLQGTFFGHSVNTVTQICLLLLLIAVWYFCISDLVHHHKSKSALIEVSNEQPAPAPVPSEEEAEEEQLETEPAASMPEPDPEPTVEPVAVSGTEETVFMPENAEGAQWVKAPESDQKPVKSEQKKPKVPVEKEAVEQQAKPAEPQAQQAPLSQPVHTLTSAEKAKLQAQMQQEKAEEKARKLQQAAAEKQAQRARKLEEETARQKKKLEDLKAEAARKKAATPPKRTYWNTNGD